jgi:hypothetical protein
MSTLYFMPWCHLVKEYKVGEATLIPFERSKPPIDLNDLTTYPIKLILNSYRGSTGHPVRHFAIVKLEGHSALDDLSQDDRESLWNHVSIACLAGLAKRDFFGTHGPYCNSDCFLLYGQRFDRQPDFAAMLLTAQKDRWSIWQDSIDFFNQANTDAETIRWQVEWVLMCGAFQRLFQTGHSAEKTATAFVAAAVPDHPFTRTVDRELLKDWMLEFQRLRGDFAHGRSNTQKVHRWTQADHLVMGAIAFPLVLTSLLVEEAMCTFRDQDYARVVAFESLLKQTLTVSPREKSWLQLLAESQLKFACFKALEDIAQPEEPPTE